MSESSSKRLPDESQPLLDASQGLQASSYNSLNSPSGSPAPEGPSQFTRADLIWILIGLWSTTFLSAIDGTIVATLVSPIGSYFKKAEQSSYLGTSYLLSVCCFTPLYGRLSDILGRKGAMLLALSLFGSGTIACGLAPSMEMLILARAIAGMGGGGVITVTNIALTNLVPLRQRGMYQGMTSTVFGLGGALGGPIGGWINDTWGWRAAFLAQSPVLFLAFVLVSTKVNINLSVVAASENVYSKLRKMDFLGSFTLVAFIASMLIGFSIRTTEELPWTHPLIWGLLALSCVFGLTFIWVETRWAQYPVMPLRLIVKRTPLAVALSNFTVAMTSFSTIYNVPLYFSAVKLNSATDAGLHLLPHSLALPIGSMLVGWWIHRTGNFYNASLISTALVILSSVLIALWNDKTPALDLWFDIVPQGFGLTGVATATLIAMIASVDMEDMAVATGVVYLFRTTGQVLGVSLSAVLAQGILLDQLRKRIRGPGSLQIIEEIRHSIDVIPNLDPSLRTAATESYATALRVVFISQIAMGILTFVACAFIKQRPLS